MSGYAFIELPRPLDAWVTTPDVLFPVRSQLAAELQSSDASDPAQLLLELERYLDEHPDRQSRFAEAGGQLAFRNAVELFTNGLKEESLQFYELSLRLRPGDPITRLNYAIALHVLAYRAEALDQYKLLMAQVSPRENLRVWVLAAQIHFLHGEYAEVLRLLEPLAETCFPQDEEFWELLGEARAQVASAAESGLDGFHYYELKPEVREQWHLPPTPFPVRPERRQQVFPDGGPVDVLALLEELRLFLDRHGELNELYEPLLGALAYLAGMAAAARGEHEQALDIYEMGLVAEPASIPLRSHYALSLHCLGRHTESRRELERVVADTPKGTLLPLVWMMLVRSYADEGKYAKADALLTELVAVDSAANTFREFLAAKLQEADARKKAAEIETQRGTKGADARTDTKPSQPWYYVVAGKSVGPVTAAELQGLLARGGLSPDTLVWNPSMPDWCCAKNVGQESPPKLPPDLPVKPLQGARCPKCNLEVTSDMRFCTRCGTALTTG